MKSQAQDWLTEDDLIRRAGSKGVPGAGGGRAAILAMPPEFLATTVQACGMYPWAIGGSTPMIGVPMGTNLLNSSTVCFDPIAWFTARPRLCDNPSIFVLGLPHKGKSTMVAHMLIGMAARGIRPLILGDLKPDYVQVVRELGGQVIRLGRGQGRWNPLTPGNIFAAADHIEAAPRALTRQPDFDEARCIELDKLPVGAVLEAPEQPATLQIFFRDRHRALRR